MARGLRLTPETLRAAYAYLLTTKPFCDWDLPEPEDMGFKVSRARCYGFSETGKRAIGISIYRIGRTDCLMETMAHEMIHQHLDKYGVKSHHGKPFQRAAEAVCREHGFDPKRFI
jgi:hypothetical protein